MAKIAKLVARNVVPKFEHDCDKCKFLGTLDNQDMYTCTEGNMGIKTYLFRFSDRGQDYRTTPASIMPQIGPGSPESLAFILDTRNHAEVNSYVTIDVDAPEIKY